MINLFNIAGCLLFVCLSFIPSSKAAILSVQKAVVIDKDWVITSEYRYTISIDSEDEEIAYSEIFLPKNNPVRLVKGAFGRYGNGDRVDNPAKVNGNRLLLKDLQTGNLVHYGFAIETQFPGFEKTFTDRFQICQEKCTGTVRYSLAFPEPTLFQWVIESGEVENASEQVRRIEAGQFIWDSHYAAPAPEGAVLRITTFMSWDEVAQHYLGLYDQIVGTGINLKALSGLSVPNTASEDEKVETIVQFLENNFEYRAYVSETHFLLPDTPSIVLNRKWGDCKDLTLLGVVLLRSLGIDAFPVLVGPENQSKMACDFPDPFSLEHAVLGIQEIDFTKYYDWTLPTGKVDLTGKQVIPLRRVTS